jgi:hypothetical protein
LKYPGFEVGEQGIASPNFSSIAFTQTNLDKFKHFFKKVLEFFKWISEFRKFVFAWYLRWSTRLFIQILCFYPDGHIKFGKHWFHSKKKLFQILPFKDFSFLKNKITAVKLIPSVMRRCNPGVGRNLYLRFDISVTLF